VKHHWTRSAVDLWLIMPEARWIGHQNIQVVFNKVLPLLSFANVVGSNSHVVT